MSDSFGKCREAYPTPHWERIRKDGKVRKHCYPSNPRGTRCPGSSKLPLKVSAPVPSEVSK